MFALDTNTLVYFFQGKGRVAERLLAAAPREVAIPAVVLYELEVGVSQSRRPEPRRQALQWMAEAVQVLPLDEAAARAAANIRVALEQSGQGIGPLDTLIAGTALARGATLVTHNTGEFSRVPGLALADWF